MTKAIVRKNLDGAVEADWKSSKPTYDDLVRLNQKLYEQLLGMAELQSRVKSLKQELAESEFANKKLKEKILVLEKHTALLNKDATNAMLLRASEALMKQQGKVEGTTKKPTQIVKCEKTEKWIEK